MRRLTFLLIPLFVFACTKMHRPKTDSIVGRWQGYIELNKAKQDIIIDILNDAGGIRALLSIPNAMELETPLANLQYSPPRLSLEMRKGSEKMTLKGSCKGDVMQLSPADGGPPLRFELERTGQVPPLPYDSEEVTVRSGDGNLSGTIFTPRSSGPHPAIVLVHGSGRQTRDGLRFYADFFARNGLIALTYDKRQVEIINGNEIVKARDLATDVLDGVQLLKERKEVIPTKIGLWGGSQGAGVAATAASMSKDIAFVIGVSGGGISYTELVTYQTGNRLRKRGFSERDISQAIAVIEKLHLFIHDGANPQQMQALLNEASTNSWAGPAGIPAKLPDEHEIKSWRNAQYLDNTKLSWSDVKIPILLIWGENDMSVPVNASVKNISEALTLNRNSDVTIKVFSGADHALMLPAGARADTNGKWDFSRLAPGYLELMASWALERTRKP